MNIYKREKYLRRLRGFFHDTELIKVITGVRRCGKSCLMASIADELRETGIPNSRILFLDLDSKKYRKIKTPDQLDALIEEAGAENGTIYVFIDEVQNVSGFESVIQAYAEEYRPFRSIKDGYPRYIITLDRYRDQQEGVHHISAIDLFLGNESL